MVANFGKCRTAVFLASALAILATVSVCAGGGYGADLAWMNVTTVGGGVAAAASGVTISESFGETETGALTDWDKDIGDFDIGSGVASDQTGDWGMAGIIHKTSLTGANGYIKVKIPAFTGNKFPIIIFRYTNATSPHYAILMDQYCSMAWKRYATVLTTNTDLADTDIGTCNAGDSIGVTWTGTGDDTVVRVWKNPTANAPVSAAEWDSGDSTPEAEHTANPAAPVNTGSKVGLGGLQDSTSSGITFDDFYAGDLP